MVAIDSPRTTLAARAGPSGPLLLFMACTLMPIMFHLGGLLLSPTRILLLVSFIPVVGMVMAGRAGRVTPIDWLFLVHGAWILIALFATHGMSRVPFSGITMVEVLGGYFWGRLFIRDRVQFQWFLKLCLGFLVLMLPLTVHELITGTQLVNETLGRFFETPLRGGSAYGRLGLERVYSVFEHPILFGLFSSMLLTNVYIMVSGGKGVDLRVLLALGVILFCTFAALSSGPLLASVLQILLLAWNTVMKGRWKLLAVLFAIFYVALDLASDRTPVTIMLDTLTFNSGSAWTRIFIFEYGWAAVERSPIFGIGFNDYPKPHWLTASVDNFWLVVALRYGMVGVGLLVAAYVMHFRAIAKAGIGNAADKQVRLGYLVTLFALALTLVTVHIWGNMSVIVMFFIGAGSWFYTTDLSGGDPGGETEAPSGRARGAYNRAAPAAAGRYTRYGPGTTPAARARAPRHRVRKG